MRWIARGYGYATLACFSAAAWTCGWPLYMSLTFQGFILLFAGLMEFLLRDFFKVKEWKAEAWQPTWKPMPLWDPQWDAAAKLGPNAVLEKAARLCDAADKSTHPSDLAVQIRALKEGAPR